MPIQLVDSGPNELLLNRQEAERRISQHFGDTVVVLRDLVDYETHLIPRCWVSSEQQMQDIVLLPVLLKQVVGLLDAAEVLIRAGAVQPALLQLRALFEATVYLDWILHRDTERRARAYHVSNLRIRLRWARRAKRGTREHREFRSEMRSLGYTDPFQATERQKLVVQEEARIARHLATEFRAMNLAFDRRRGKRLYDPDWYEVLFPRKGRKRPPSLKTLSRHVHRLPEYRIIYEQGSEMMHSARWDHHLRHDDEGIWFRGLRELDEIGHISQLMMGAAIEAFTTILRHYRPSELENFGRKYVETWRTAFLARRTVKYDRQAVELS